MGYKKHFAYFHEGDFMESYLCTCDRITNHMASRPGSRQAEPTLFELDGMGEMRAS